MENGSKGILLYILKCIFGCLIVFLISWLINYNDISWCMISVILVITPDSDESIPLAITRIKAKIIGGLASLLCFLINLPIAVSINSAIVITIIVTFLFHKGALRKSLVKIRQDEG